MVVHPMQRWVLVAAVVVVRQMLYQHSAGMGRLIQAAVVVLPPQHLAVGWAAQA